MKNKGDIMSNKNIEPSSAAQRALNTIKSDKLKVIIKIFEGQTNEPASA